MKVVVYKSDSPLREKETFLAWLTEDREVVDSKGKKTGEKRLLVPRYHQLDAVRRLIADAREKGARYPDRSSS